MRNSSKNSDIQNFYGSLAGEYDTMTNFEERVQKEQKIFQKWIDRYSIDTALDAACGTGLHVIVLSQLGVKTIGADISTEMLNQARQNAERVTSEIKWIQVPMQNISQEIDEKFDAIFCLGNSLPHLILEKDVKAAFKGFADMLNPEGVLALQILNYHKILEEKNRIVNIKRNADLEFIRFYDFLENLLRFNILKIKWEGDRPTHQQLVSTKLKPYLEHTLVRILKDTGFGNLKAYGNIFFEPFVETESANLVLVANKS